MSTPLELDEITEWHERTVLAALMKDPLARDVILPQIKPQFLRCPKHHTILGAIFELLDDRKEPGLLAVCQRLEDAKNLEKVGGSDYVTQIQLTTGTIATAQFALSHLRDQNKLLRQAEIGSRMVRGEIEPTEVIQQLTELYKPDSRDDLTIRSAAEILSLKLDADDCLMGDRLLAKGQPLVIAGASGIGKSRLLLQLAVCCISGRPWCGLDTHAQGLRWLILQTENSNRRLQFDLNALRKWHDAGWDNVEHNLLIKTVETDLDAILILSDPEVRRRIDRIIQSVKPDIIGLDPLRDLIAGDPNSDQDMASTISELGALCRRGNPQRTPVVLHHSLTGKMGASKAIGFDRSSFTRGSKVLHSWTRAQINVAPGAADNNETLVLACGKNSNGREFEPFAVRLNPQTMIYESDEQFDVDSWREEISAPHKSGRRSFSPLVVPEILNGRELSKSELASAIMAEEGCGRSRAYELIIEAEKKRSVFRNKATNLYGSKAA